ncbi:ABC transporter transmembrane domain-containing protein [Thermosipho sp. 1070]|uniref:ABC transporter transmembrane domain-containing protein n=1 Tax=Thermosipho sp. 1070 TaxID=1437364 RepID=UPI000B4BAE0B|nr:ABC transporter ATP-binding protein [Thermosipho sp. 1070]
MKIYWEFLKTKRFEFILLLIFSSILSFFEGLIQPLMVKWLFDEAVLKLNFQKFVLLSVVYLALGLIFVLLFYINNLWKKRYENKVVLNLESELLKKTFNYDLKEFTKKGAGYFINSIHKDVNEGVVPMIRMTINIVSMIVSEVALLLAMFFISWRASLVLFIIIPPLMYLANVVSQKVRKKTALEREKEGIYTSFLTSVLKSFKVMRTFSFIFDIATLKHRRTLEELFNYFLKYYSQFWFNFSYFGFYNVIKRMNSKSSPVSPSPFCRLHTSMLKASVVSPTGTSSQNPSLPQTHSPSFQTLSHRTCRNFS